MTENSTTVSVPAITLKGLSKSFGSRAALKRINLEIPSACGLCVCGPNAAGKTTLLKIIATALNPSAGRVSIKNLDTQQDYEKIKPLIGVVFDKPMLYPHLTVIENLRFFARLYRTYDAASRIEELLKLTGLAPSRYDQVAVLSRGMTQRLAIARSLIHRPQILLADEPFTGLDGIASQILLNILAEFKKAGGTFVMTTHSIGPAISCCDVFAVLDKAELIFSEHTSRIDLAEFQQDYLSYARRNA